MEPQLIQFLTQGPYAGPRPYPASMAAPAWLRNMNAENPLPGTGQVMPTVKRCPPFLDAITWGYIIPMPGDLTLTRKGERELEFRSTVFPLQVQNRVEFKGAPFEQDLVIKILSPWLVRTPPGYSTLFTQPMNRFDDLPIQVLSGVVDTESYYMEVNFPAVCRLKIGATATIPAGTPLVQVIPLKREPWMAEYGQFDMLRRGQMNEEMQKNPSFYKDQYRQKKSFM